jgi:hypothetical protein
MVQLLILEGRGRNVRHRRDACAAKTCSGRLFCQSKESLIGNNQNNKWGFPLYAGLCRAFISGLLFIAAINFLPRIYSLFPIPYSLTPDP